MLIKSIWSVKISSSLVRVVKRSFSVSRRESLKSLASKDGEFRVFIVAGEVSGDIIAARFMNSLSALSPFPIRFAGVGGSMMSKQGLKSMFPMEDISVMGIWELLPHLSKFRAKLKETVDSALTFQPHVILTVDSKGFSFRFLKQMRTQCEQKKLVSPRHFHYVAPSFWAWRGGEERLKRLSEFVDHVFCILPFEAEVCNSNGLAANFVGHPTLEDALEIKASKLTDEEWKIQGDKEDFRMKYGISSEATIISVLPGSRLQEVKRMLPIFLQTMGLINDEISTAVIHVAPNKHVEEYISKSIRDSPVPVVLFPSGQQTMKYNSFSASKLALCASGTVAVELQLARLPCVVAYRAHFLTEWFIRYKAKIPYISLPNIILNSPVIPEALFGECNPSQLAKLMKRLLHDESFRQQQISSAEAFLDSLSPVKRKVSSFSNQGEPTLPEYTPSMIAAYTVLNS